MTYYNMPFESEEEIEDKVVGGYLSVRQFLWLSIPVLTLLTLFLWEKSYIIVSDTAIKVNIVSIIIRIIITVISLIGGVCLAFLKRKSINLDEYLFGKFLFKARQTLFLYEKF